MQVLVDSRPLTRAPVQSERLFACDDGSDYCSSLHDGDGNRPCVGSFMSPSVFVLATAAGIHGWSGYRFQSRSFAAWSIALSVRTAFSCSTSSASSRSWQCGFAILLSRHQTICGRRTCFRSDEPLCIEAVAVWKPKASRLRGAGGIV